MSAYMLRTAVRPIGRRRLIFYPSSSTIQRRRVSTYGYEQAKALVFSSYGEPKDNLRLHSHSISPPHGTQVTVRFLASPLNPADINQLQGTYPSKPSFTTSLGTPDPIAVGGNEGVAEVVSAGKDSGVQQGDWVIMKRPGFGTWRTHAQGDASSFLVLPQADKEGITPVQAGTVSVNPCTAYGMLKGYIGGGHSGSTLNEGEWFIQNGANSGVGRAAIQLGRQWGLKSINLVRARPGGEAETQSLKDELKELGADVVVTEEEAHEKGWTQKVKEWTNGGREPVKLGMNCVGGRSAFQLAKGLSKGGWHLTYGAMAKQPMQLPAGMLIFNDLRFAGFWVSQWSDRETEKKKQAVFEIFDFIRQGKFKDTPVQEIRWDWTTDEATLKEPVQGTLEGFRKGKGVFVFGDT